MRKVWRGVAGATALALCSAPVFAADVPIPAKIAIIKPANIGKFVAKPVGSFTLPTGGDAPTTIGATLNMFDTGSTAGNNTYGLPQANWSGLGNPPGSKGFKYKGAGAGSDPCKVVIIKEAVIKAVCKGTAIALTPPFGGQLGIILKTSPTFRYCAALGGTNIKNQPGLLKRKDAPAPVTCPVVVPPTTSTTTTVTTTTTTTTLAACCGPMRIQLTSSAGTLQVDNLPAFPFPVGVVTKMDVAGGATPPSCQHNVVVPAGGFSVPNFGIPALGYCSMITDLHCETGAGEGAGKLWDGHGTTAAATDITKSADTSDGVCNPPGQPCTTAGAGNNTLGDIDSVATAVQLGGVRSALDIRVHSTTWLDSVCTPIIGSDCCPGSTYNPADGDLTITQFDFILSPTTGVGTGQFVDKNLDGCKRAGSGFDTAAPGPDGPKSLTGSAAAGPCCTVGQATTVVSVGIGFSGGAPLYDLGFKSTIPNTVQSCGSIGSDTCVVTTDPCLQ